MVKTLAEPLAQRLMTGRSMLLWLDYQDAQRTGSTQKVLDRVRQVIVPVLQRFDRFFVAEGRVCWGQVKHVTISKMFSSIAFSKIGDSTTEIRVLKIVYIFAEFAQSAPTFAHRYFLLATPPSPNRDFT